MVRRAFSGCSLLLFYLTMLLIFFRTRSCPNSTPQSHHTDTQTPLPLPHLHESARNTISETLSHPPRAAGTGEVPPHRQTALHTPLPRLHLLGLCGSVCSPPGNLIFPDFSILLRTLPVTEFLPGTTKFPPRGTFCRCCKHLRR